jgi:hypothetical protein
MLKKPWTGIGSVISADGLMNAMSMKKMIRGGQNNEINKDFDTGNRWRQRSLTYQRSAPSGD